MSNPRVLGVIPGAVGINRPDLIGEGYDQARIPEIDYAEMSVMNACAPISSNRFGMFQCLHPE